MITHKNSLKAIKTIMIKQGNDKITKQLTMKNNTESKATLQLN